MLSFIRNLTKSRVGLIAVFVLLGVIAIAFAAGDITGSRPVGASSGGEVIARVGDREITEQELRDRIDIAIDNMRRQGQSFDMETFLAGGGLDYALEQVIDNAVLQEFGERTGMRVSDRIVDGMIASNPAFQGPTGGFDQQLFESVLNRERISERALRQDLRNARFGDWLTDPTIGARQIPAGMVLPYASLLLERREGAIGFIPTLAMNPGETPTDEELAQYYQRNRAQYTVPERRIVRYATVGVEDVEGRAAPTDAEIAQAYRGAGDRFAARETRTVQQVVVGDQAAAQRLAEAVRGGQSLAAAASAAGFEPRTFEDVERAALAGETSDAVAQAAFSASEGSVAGPVQSPLGWHVLRVDSVDQIPARSLAQARDELVEELRARKVAQLMADMHGSIDEGIGEGGTFDELIAANDLEAQRTPPLLPSGVNPDAPDAEPNEMLQPILRAAYLAEVGDEPQIVPISPEQFALVSLERVVPPTARPLDSIRERVVRDYMIGKAQQRAREVARDVVQAVNRGSTLQQALAAAGVRGLPAPQPINTTRAQLATAQEQVPPPLQLMFSMSEGRARLLEAENRQGFYVVHLEEIEEADASGNEELLRQTRAGIGGVIGQELAQQFVEALRGELRVTRDAEALQRLRESLASTGTAGR